MKYSDFLNLDNMEIHEGFISFFIFSENEMVDGVFDYEKFMKYMLEEKGCQMFDECHVLIPSISKQEIEKIIEYIQKEKEKNAN